MTTAKNGEEVEPAITAENEEEVELTTQQMEQEAVEHGACLFPSTYQYEKLNAV